MPTLASMVARSKLSAWAFFPHSMRICPERSFFMSLTAPAMPLIPFSIAKGDKLLRGAESSVELSTMNRGQYSFSESESESSIKRFLGLEVEESIVKFWYVHHPWASPAMEPYLGMCRAADFQQITHQGYKGGILKQ